MQIPVELRFDASAPPAVASCTPQVQGPGGLATYYYWIDVAYPVGHVLSGPFPVYGAPSLAAFSGTNKVFVSWVPIGTGVLNYTVLRTATRVAPKSGDTAVVAAGVAGPPVTDTGTLTAYTPVGLPSGSPVFERLYLNN